jgi:DmsE family decaheme c-type cytochrome
MLQAATGLAFLVVLSPGFADGQAPPAPTPAAEKPAPEKPAPEKKEAPPLCVDCHEDQGKSFRGNAHTRVPGVSWGKSVSDNKACESCHGAGAKHMDSAGEDKSDIRVFQGRPGADFCLTCHTNLSASLSAHTSFRTGPPEGINCLSCHSVHSSAPRTPRLLQKTPTALCASCHPARAAAFHDKPFAHRIGRGGMECTSCHDPHGLPENHGLRLTRTGEMPCLTCHAEKRGPFVFEHAPLFIGNCLSCHEPHGSSNQKMLIRARVDQLCLECHSTLNLSTLGSQPPATHNVTLPRWRNCTTCHTAIHGSNLSPRLFK